VLKTFIHEVYGCRLTAMALQSTSGQNGYANQMIYNVLADGVNNETNNNMVTTITQTAALTAASGGTGHTSGAGINAKVATAINQLSATQLALMAQMAILSFGTAPPPTQQTHTLVPNVPPIQQVAIPVLHPWTRGFNTGQGGRRGGRGQGHGGCSGSRPSCTLFADTMHGTGATPMMNSMIPFNGATYGGENQQPTMPGGQTQCHKAEFSNIYKIHNNWNVCFSWGFDVKDDHMSSMCPFKKWNHQDQFVCKNAQQFIVVGYDPCTKGMHKTVLPSGRGTLGSVGRS
jgi:hypothetical protein